MGHAIGFTEGNRLVAGVAYFWFTGWNVWTAIAAEHSRWATREHLYRLSEYPFEQLKVKRISAWIDADNERSIRIAEHLGYKYEATLANASRHGDALLYRATREDCRWFAPQARKRTFQLLRKSA